MPDPRSLYYALVTLAAGLAWTLAASRREHRGVALVLTWLLSVELARKLVGPELDAAGAWPYTGRTLWLYFLDHALELSVRFTMVAAVVAHFSARPVTSVAIAYAAAFAFLVVYKLVTAASLVPVHQVLSGLTALACVIAIGHRALRRSDAPSPDGAHAALLVLAATDLANAMAHASHTFDAWWSELVYADAVAVAVLVIGYATALGKETAARWRQAS